MLLSEWSRFQTKPKLFSLVESSGRYMDLEALGEDIVRSPLVRIWWNLLNSCENLLPIVNWWSLVATYVDLVVCWWGSGGNLVGCSGCNWWQLLVSLWWQFGGLFDSGGNLVTIAGGPLVADWRWAGGGQARGAAHGGGLLHLLHHLKTHPGITIALLVYIHLRWCF